MIITPIIGLEIHVQIKTQTKAFCACSAHYFGDKPNTHTCPVCLGLPGALPTLNEEFVRRAVLVGLALDPTHRGDYINLVNHFDRKNYFYPDLPKGYQISQFYKPIVQGGEVTIQVDGQTKTIRISEAHMEEDAAKSIHEVDCTLVDFNKAGVPLFEIVSHPDMASGKEAHLYAAKIQRIIRYLGVSDANIEEGSMRCEPTVNVKIEMDSQVLYTPLAELKNIASLKAVEQAVEYEIKRQVKEWEKTGEVKTATNKSTRGWDASKGQTFLQREKEGSADYRYFPEPDIPPLELDKAFLGEVKKQLSELPDEKIARYRSTFGLSVYDADLLTQDRHAAEAFEQALGQSSTPEYAKFVANFFTGKLKSEVGDWQALNAGKLNPKHFSYLYQALTQKTISTTVAYEVALRAYKNGGDPEKIIQQEGLAQVSDEGAIQKLAKKVITANPKAVADYQKNPASIGFLVGQLMKVSGGSANPQKAQEVLKRLLG